MVNIFFYIKDKIYSSFCRKMMKESAFNVLPRCIAPKKNRQGEINKKKKDRDRIKLLQSAPSLECRE